MNNINKFAWSLSRSRIWNDCLTKYYLHYIFSNGVGTEDEAENMQTTAKLKYLTSLPVEVGLIIHNRIRNILIDARAGIPIPSATISAENAVFDFAKWVIESQKLDWEQITPTRKKLLRHQRGEVIPTEEIQRYKDTIRNAILNFYSLPLVKEILRHPERMMPQLIDPPVFEVVTVEGVDLVTRPDLVLSGEEAIIIDWKTGKPHYDHQRSATLLDIYIRGMFPELLNPKIKVLCVYLMEGLIEEHVITEEQRAELMALAQFEFSEMRQQHTHLEKGEPPATIFRPSPRPEVCEECAFSVACPFAKRRAS